MKKIRFRLTAYTDPAGKWNDEAPNKGNEDNLYVDADLAGDIRGRFVSDEEATLSDLGCLMVVADGMGGTNAGEVASAIAIETVRSRFRKEALADAELSTAAARERYMEGTVAEADAAIKAEARRSEACAGMGSTIIMMWLCGGEVSVTWCGDSRAYLFREACGLRQISKDHSYVQSLVDEGKITADEAFDHPYGNIITRSLGDPEKRARADSVTVPVYKGDILMLCSDGLSGMLRDEAMAAIIRQHRSSLAACREALWQAAEAAGWYDNVTACLCELTDGGACPAEADVKPVAQSMVVVRLRRRTIRRIVLILIAALAAVAAFVAIRQLLPAHGGDSPLAPRRDSLLRTAHKRGLTAFDARLQDEAAARDTAALEALDRAVARRLALLRKTERLQEACDTAYRGLRDTLARFRTTLLTSETPVDTTLLDTMEASRVHLDRIMNDRDAHLARMLTVGKIAAFRRQIVLKAFVTGEDVEWWLRLKREVRKGLLTVPPAEGAAAPDKQTPPANGTGSGTKERLPGKELTPADERAPESPADETLTEKPGLEMV